MVRLRPSRHTGPEGQEGPLEPVGSRGPTGYTDSTGPEGQTGATGQSGPTGPEGRQGLQGLAQDIVIPPAFVVSLLPGQGFSIANTDDRDNSTYKILE